MSLTIGLPRGLAYHYYGEIYAEFLRYLGAKVEISSESTKKTLALGDILEDVCIPVKLYAGHVIELSPKVDYLFIPRLVSVAKGDYNCPKMIGLPDLLRETISVLPPVLDFDINVRQKRFSIMRAVAQIGKVLGAGPMKSLAAWYQANQRYHSKNSESPAVISPSVALIGHVYLLKDVQASLNVVYYLKKTGLQVLTPDMLPVDQAEKAAAYLQKPLYWTYGRQLLGAAIAYAEGKPPVDGIIFITSFSCGPDSLIGELIKQYADKKNIPLLMLNLDGHMAEAGLLTRLEAFADILFRRRRL